MTSIIAAAQAYVTQTFQQHENDALVYHNLVHTQQVVDAATKIAAYYRLGGDELTIVLVAAWFHDIGYALGEAHGHEDTGARAAKEFMLSHHYPEAIAGQVAGCILATKIPQSPNNLLEQIVCDADLSHFGSKEFKERNRLLRQEMELLKDKKISGLDWMQSSISFLEQQHYHTAYAQTLFRQQKEENLQKLKNKLGKKEAEEKVAKQVLHKDKKKDKKAKDEYLLNITDKDVERSKKARKPERGVETMFRTTSTNHLRLSAMADSKANIMITVNSLIVSLLLSVLFRRLEDNPNLIIPTILFLSSCVTTIIFAVLATRPNITSGRFTKQDIQNKSANLLFFGNFHQMNYEEYEEGMEMIMNNSDYLYSNLTMDVYNLGVVLGKKYKLLRISYNIFMFGIIVAVIAFVIAILFFPVK